MTVKWVMSLCMIHGGILLVLQLLMGCCKVPSKEKLGQLQSNRKGLKAMMSYREELYNQYIKFWTVCCRSFLLFVFPIVPVAICVYWLDCCLFHSLKQSKTDSLARSAPKSPALFIKNHLHPLQSSSFTNPSWLLAGHEREAERGSVNSPVVYWVKISRFRRYSP